jgi:hypothetical protein
MFSTRIPAAALLLGLAGLAPFIWGALLIVDLWPVEEALVPSFLTLPAVLEGDGRLIMVRYGGIILPFMAGVLWGFATRASGWQGAACYALSVLPALWWFFMPGSGVTSALVNLGIGFVALLLLDFMFQRWELAPPWWMILRVQLTLVVLICLGIGIWV